MAEPVVIETKGLRKRYGSQLVLDDIDLALPKGAIGLLGPNGAGKSTFIKCLLQLQTKDGGNVSLLGKDIDQHGRETRTRIGYAPEQDCHIPGTPIAANYRACLSRPRGNGLMKCSISLAWARSGIEKWTPTPPA